MEDKKVKKYKDALFKLDKEQKNTDIVNESYKRQIINNLPKDKNIIIEKREVKEVKNEEPDNFFKKIKKYFGN